MATMLSECNIGKAVGALLEKSEELTPREKGMLEMFAVANMDATIDYLEQMQYHRDGIIWTSGQRWLFHTVFGMQIDKFVAFLHGKFESSGFTRQDAEDAFMRELQILHKQIPHYKAEKSSRKHLPSYFMTCLIREAFDILRKIRKASIFISMDIKDKDTGETVTIDFKDISTHDPEMACAFKQVMEDIMQTPGNTKYLTWFVAHYFRGQSYKEIAEDHSTTEQTAKTRVNEIKRKIRNSFLQLGYKKEDFAL